MTAASPDGPDAPGSAVIHARLVGLVERLPVYESRIRRDEAGGVHKMRVTLRRLRSLLATYGPLFTDDVAVRLREELKWVAGELGGARDSEVVHQRVNALVSTSEERALLDRIEWELEAAASVGEETALETLDSERYTVLLRDLNALVTDPPWSEAGQGTGDELVLRRVWREWKRLRDRVAAAGEAPRGGERQAALHEVRKAAKRLRYSAETLVPLYGEDATRLARGAKQVQTELGEVQDSTVTQELLRRIAKARDTSSEQAFVLGGLHARERQLSTHAETRYAGVWAKVSRKKNLRWLR